MPIGRIGNPESMDHPKDQPLCLVLDFLGCDLQLQFYMFETTNGFERFTGVSLKSPAFLEVCADDHVLTKITNVETIEGYLLLRLHSNHLRGRA